MIHFSFRYATNPQDVVAYDTQKIREHFLIESLFTPEDIHLVY